MKIHTEKKELGLVDECLYDKLANYCVGHKMSGRDITFLCTEAIWKMLDAMNPGLEKLAEEPYEKIKAYMLKTRKVKDSDFKEEDTFAFKIIIEEIKVALGIKSNVEVIKRIKRELDLITIAEPELLTFSFGAPIHFIDQMSSFDQE